MLTVVNSNQCFIHTQTHTHTQNQSSQCSPSISYLLIKNLTDWQTGAGQRVSYGLISGEA